MVFKEFTQFHKSEERTVFFCATYHDCEIQHAYYCLFMREKKEWLAQWLVYPVSHRKIAMQNGHSLASHRKIAVQNGQQIAKQLQRCIAVCGNGNRM